MATNQQQQQVASTAAQIAWHQRWAGLLHDHATWATLAMVVVLVAKYLFNLPLTQTEVLGFFGIFAATIFGARWAQAAHIDAVRRLAQVQADSQTWSPAFTAMGDAIRTAMRGIVPPGPPPSSGPASE
jgi:hypothetical protein